ncbi:phosphotransferase [Porphyromonas gingivalis]|uniref:phosphotransferase n=1 Tax=Porphyromonas gingivalis TaxID=837 RepID=UPI001F37D2B1|nr:phosphotransferase [Porphyromonas gingivalis]MCE8193089.1 phosphotransferase [Porphyromonas gingivalis]
MKRCDLHIHTVPSVSDREFTYDKEILSDYVAKTKLDVIAITNHNLFDYAQFQEIKDILPQIVVLPGIEVDLEDGHILVIANNDDRTLLDFNSKCEEIKNLIKSEADNITYDRFVGIFGDLSKYLLIPHYEKEPKLRKDILEKLGRNIIAGEVSSIKKFIYMEKERAGLTPVYFSDFRIEKGITPDKYPVSHTFFDVDEVNIKTLKLCLMDKTKVSLTSEEGIKLFPIFPNGQKLSTGLNIMYGKRSTGKTFTLDAIASRFNGKAKYIKQFELLNTNRNDSEQFESDMKVRQEKSAEDYLREFSEVVTEMLKTCSSDEDDIKLQKYLDAVKSSAQQSNVNDVFSKSKLFNESDFKERSCDEIKRLINATKTLLESQLYKQIINKHLSEISLKALLKDLIELYWEDNAANQYVKEVNNMIKMVKESLQLKSAAPRIPDIDLYQYFINKKKREVFAQIAMSVKKSRTISTEKAGHFTVCVSARPFMNATDLKTVRLKQRSLTNAFEKYENPVQYLNELKAAGVEINRIYKLFAAIDYKILNSSGLPVSGGERSEFNFLQKIKDAILCDILIIDEPESSFDNIFLKNEVNKFIKEMAENMPVIISTHNNTIGSSIKPDYILYTEKKMEADGAHFKIYSGYPTAKELRDVDGNTIENYEITLNSLEAGEQAYSERKDIYETLKN